MEKRKCALALLLIATTLSAICVATLVSGVSLSYAIPSTNANDLHGHNQEPYKALLMGDPKPGTWG